MVENKFNVVVKETSDGYKVTVKNIEEKTTRNTRIGFSPEKLISSTLGVIFKKKKTINAGIRVYAGKKKTEKTVIDQDEMLLDKNNWETQLDRWADLEKFDDATINEIKKEIRKIIIVKGE